MLLILDISHQVWLLWDSIGGSKSTMTFTPSSASFFLRHVFRICTDRRKSQSVHKKIVSVQCMAWRRRTLPRPISSSFHSGWKTQTRFDSWTGRDLQGSMSVFLWVCDTFHLKLALGRIQWFLQRALRSREQALLGGWRIVVCWRSERHTWWTIPEHGKTVRLCSVPRSVHWRLYVGTFSPKFFNASTIVPPLKNRNGSSASCLKVHRCL